MKKTNLIFKILATIYLSIMSIVYFIDICNEWDGHNFYVICFLIFTLLNLWRRCLDKLNFVCILFMWGFMILRYVYNILYNWEFDWLVDTIVITLQLLPITSVILDYSYRIIKEQMISAWLQEAIDNEK